MSFFFFTPTSLFACGLVDMCCFPLAEAWKKRKTFFSHTSGSLAASVRGVEVTWLMRFPTFLVAVRHCLTSRPPTLLVFWTFFPGSFSISCCLGIFICIRSFSYCSFHIIFWLVCLSCYESTLSKYLFFHWFSLWLIKVRLHGSAWHGSAWHGYQLCVRTAVLYQSVSGVNLLQLLSRLGQVG